MRKLCLVFLGDARVVYLEISALMRAWRALERLERGEALVVETGERGLVVLKPKKYMLWS